MREERKPKPKFLSPKLRHFKRPCRRGHSTRKEKAVLQDLVKIIVVQSYKNMTSHTSNEMVWIGTGLAVIPVIVKVMTKYSKAPNRPAYTFLYSAPCIGIIYRASGFN